MEKEKENRFKVVVDTSDVYLYAGFNTTDTIRVLCDKETGVEYLNYGGCVLPLLDQNGLPKINEKYKRNEKVCSGIQFHCLEDKKMEELGFVEDIYGRWVYEAFIDYSPAAFKLWVQKDGRQGSVSVSDSINFMPYELNCKLNTNEHWTEDYKTVKRVKEKVEKIMFTMQQAGVISGWKFGMRI